MSKTMTVDILSSIKGAKPSESVNQLFDVIKNAVPSNATTLNNVNHNCVSVSDLREDVVIASSAMEKQLIIENFPSKKNGNKLMGNEVGFSFEINGTMYSIESIE